MKIRKLSWENTPHCSIARVHNVEIGRYHKGKQDNQKTFRVVLFTGSTFYVKHEHTAQMRIREFYTEFITKCVTRE